MKHTTKRFLAIIMVLAMCLSLLPGIALAANEYVLVTNVADITSGGQFVIVANDLAMPTTLSSGKFNGVAVTPNGNTLSGDDLPVWTFEAVDGGIAISIDGSYLAYKSSTNFQMATSAYTWTVTEANGGFVLDSAATTRGIYLQTSSSKFGAYAQSNATATGYVSGLQLYKLADGTVGCSHEYVSEVVAATCTEEGLETFTCSLCGDSYTKAIPAAGHSYADGTCTVCGETAADLSGNYYIAALRSGTYWYMTSDLGTASTKRYVAVDSGLTELPASIEAGLADRTFTLSANSDGTYTICVAGDENGYLGWTSGNSGALVAADSALALTIDMGETSCTIVAASNSRNLSLNSTKGNNYFAFYTGSQINDLYLIPVAALGGECAHSNTNLVNDKAATCTDEGYTGDTVCADCGETVTAGEAIAALGHTNEDADYYFCDVCGTQLYTDAVYNKTTVLNVGDVVLLISELATSELSRVDYVGEGTTYYNEKPVGLMPLTVVEGASESTFAFQTSDGLYLAWVSGNSLQTADTLDDNSSWTVSFDLSGNAAIVNSGDADRSIRWNKTSPRFACYTSGQTDVQLYKQVTENSCTHYGTFTIVGYVAATCTTDGYGGNTICDICGDTVHFEGVIPAYGHTEVVEAAVDATCTKAGSTEGKHCETCGEVITAVKTVTAAGHSFTDGICTVCGEAEVAAPDADTILADAYALAVGDALPYTATLTGTITEINTEYNADYANISVTIVVDGNEDKSVLCYRLTGDGIDTLAVGDTITVSGNIVNYNGTVEFAAGCTLVSIAAPKEYCLVGWINNANYGCEDDYENIGEYIFVDGTLTTSFTADSYIFVKTTDNANWLMAEAYTEETSATFMVGANEKMKVPANYEITFTLVENTDGSVTVSYVLGDKIETEPAYYVAGSFNDWNAADEEFKMTTNEDGTYTYSIDLVAGNYEFKVTDGTWTNSWGDNGGNYAFTVGYFGTVTITFDPTTTAITVTGDCLGEKEPIKLGNVSVAGEAGLTGVAWDPNANLMEANGFIYTISFDDVAAGTYQFKFVSNGNWDTNWASGIEIASGETQTAWFKAQGNSSITVAENNSTVTLVFDATNMDIYTGEGATMYAKIDTPVLPWSNTLVLGDNALTLAAGDVDGDTWTYTATEAGTLSINITALATDNGEGIMEEVPADYIGMVFSRQYSVVINGTPNYAYPAEVAVAAGDTVTVLITSGMGTATNLTLNLELGAAVEPEPAEPGSAENPIVIESLPYNIIVAENHDVYYTYIAEQDGILTISKPEGCYVSGLPNYEEVNGVYYVNVTAGETISLNPWGSSDGMYSIAYGEAPTYEDVAIYFNNVLYDWANVNAYVWDGNGNPVGAEWPGAAMTQNEDGFWTITVPSNALYVIFNNGDAQTTELDLVAGSIYDGINYAVYGTELNTNFHVTGDGVFGEWAADNANGLMTNNGNGIFTVTFESIEAGTYGIKVTDGTWVNNWGYWGDNVTVEVAELSDVTVTFNLNTTEITYEAVPVAADPVVIPTLALKSPALEFKDMIKVIAFFTAENIDDVVEMGMVTYTEKVDVIDVNTAAHVIPGADYEAGSGRYYASSQGINAKYLADTVYLACYAKLSDGTYVYTKLAPYSPITYATNQLKNSTNMPLKQLVVAMLNYGAAAQTYFNYNVDNLANASLTEDLLALPEAYRADMVSTVPAVDAAKQGEFANNKGFSLRKPAVSFEGAFSINYFFTPAYTPVDGVTLYYWTGADFDNADVLTVENATGSLKLSATETEQLRGDITGIAAKNIAQAVYVAAVYSDGTTTWTSGVLGYSIGAYCSSMAKGSDAMADLAKATAVYGYHANAYFNQAV